MPAEVTSDAIWYIVRRCIKGPSFFTPRTIYLELQEELCEGIEVNPREIVKALQRWERKGLLGRGMYSCASIHIRDHREFSAGDNDAKGLPDFSVYFPLAMGDRVVPHYSRSIEDERLFLLGCSVEEQVLSNNRLLWRGLVEDYQGKQIATFTKPNSSEDWDVVVHPALFRDEESCNRFNYAILRGYETLSEDNVPPELDVLTLERQRKCAFPVAVGLSEKEANLLYSLCMGASKANYVKASEKIQRGESLWEQTTKILFNHCVKTC